MRQDQDWSGAYQIYSQLAVLFEREPRYQKLEREILTLLRLDHIFKEDANWKERIEKVRWKDAETALRHIDGYYVHEANFKEVAEDKNGRIYRPRQIYTGECLREYTPIQER